MSPNGAGEVDLKKQVEWFGHFMLSTGCLGGKSIDAISDLAFEMGHFPAFANLDPSTAAR